MRWPIALTITISLFLIAPFFRKWVDLVVWPRLVDWWASRTQRKLRAKIVKLEERLKESEAEWTYDKVAWLLTLQSQDIADDSLLANNFWYMIAISIISSLWKPLATLTGSTITGWSLVFNLLFAYCLNLRRVIRGGRTIKRDRTMHTEAGRSLLRQRIEALKTKLT